MTRLLNLLIAAGATALLIAVGLSLPRWLEGWQIGVVAAVGFALAAYTSLRTSLPWTFTVYIWLVALLALFVGAVFALSQLGPEVLLLLMTGLSVPVAVSSVKRLLEKSGKPNLNLCQKCGYDLRASIDRCPECGEVVGGDLARRRRIRATLAAKRAEVSTVPDEEPAASAEPDAHS